MKKQNTKGPKITPPLDTFAGAKLEPMTPQREVVAAEMGMHWGFEENYRKQFYLRDTIIVLWLRSIPVEATKAQPWSVDRAELESESAMKEALSWAGRVGLRLNSKLWQPAWNIFLRTVLDIRNATGVPVIPDEDKKTTAPDTGEL
jgi:hypothetical protein